LTSGHALTLRIFIGASLVAMPVLVAAGPLAMFRDGPPAAVTGGFGEDSCYACHWDGGENDAPGAVRILGLPDQFEPGARYPLEVLLSRPGMEVGGFQLAVRTAADGEQAGSVEPGSDEKERIEVITENDIQYIQHRLGGIPPSAPDTSRWRLVWTAPATGAPVTFNVAAVAGDNDESQFGDHVYTAEVKVRPGGR